MRFSLAWILLVVGCSGSPATPSDGVSELESPDRSQVSVDFLDAEGNAVTTQHVNAPAEVRVRGARPGAHVTLSASLAGDVYGSSAVFVAGSDGTVSTKRQAPLAGGSYGGVDVDGPFWSMTARDPANTKVASADVTVHAHVDGRDIAQATLARPFVGAGVQKRDVTEQGLVGAFYTPATPGPHPAIIAFGGSEGGLDTGDRYARFLASLGYAALGLAYFGAPGLPATLDHVPLEYFATAIAWLKARPEVVPTKIGVMGASRGGELALLLGATFADVHAVVGPVPSGLVWPGTSGAAWTYQGKEVVAIKQFGQAQVTKDPQGRTVVVETPAFQQAIAKSSAAEIDAATTRVEKTQGPILMLAAGDDQLWPSCRLSQIAMDRLTAAGHTARYADELHCYPHTGHFLTPSWAGLPTTQPQELTIGGALFFYGGDAPGLGHGDRDAYVRLQAFLANALK
jgi:dienelactone hydrolase